ncbi:hypothetical protein RZN22_06795 [Bacillaceae bacterium S4-13-58]
MKIKQIHGYELDKEKSNSPEDFFNRSEVLLDIDGEDHVFSLLYVRYFDELRSEFTPFESDPIMIFGEKTVDLKDVVALIALIRNPEWKSRKKVYISELEDYKKIFKDIKWDSMQQLCMKIADGKSYYLESNTSFIED